MTNNGSHFQGFGIIILCLTILLDEISYFSLDVISLSIQNATIAQHFIRPMFALIFYSNKDIYPLKHIFETLTLQLFHIQVSRGRC